MIINVIGEDAVYWYHSKIQDFVRRCQSGKVIGVFVERGSRKVVELRCGRTNFV